MVLSRAGNAIGAVGWPSRLIVKTGMGRVSFCPLGRNEQEASQRSVQLLDPSKMRVGELDRRQLTTRKQLTLISQG